MKIKRATKQSSLYQIVKLVVPILVGMAIGFSWNNITHTVSSNPSLESDISSMKNGFTKKVVHGNVSSNNQISTATFADHKDIDGWKAVYVYYGKEEGLHSSKPPMLNKEQNSAEGSQVKQDEIINALMTAYQMKEKNDVEKDFYFIDLAANDATALSNTYKLEMKGWTGLCIEPNPIYWFRLAHRKCMVAGTFVGGVDLKEVEVALKTNEFGGIVGDNFDNSEKSLKSFGSASALAEKEKRYTISILTMFQQFDVPKTIDYLSLDVEGAEELIMKEFPFDSYKIRFLTIERPKVGLTALLEKMNYHFVMMLVFWGETLWVHESVLGTMDMDEIKKIVTKNKVHARRISKGQSYWDIKKGDYVIMK